MKKKIQKGHFMRNFFFFLHNVRAKMRVLLQLISSVSVSGSALTVQIVLDLVQHYKTFSSSTETEINPAHKC